jgi:hypothetical protein
MALGYLGTYLLNAWLDSGVLPIIVFTAIFVVGYVIIWAIIYSIIGRNTAKLNEMLKKIPKPIMCFYRIGFEIFWVTQNGIFMMDFTCLH